MQSVDTYSWQQGLAAVIALLGLIVAWRGVYGGPGGQRGLLRREVDMLQRLEGWRLLLTGLMLVGIGAAWFWDLRWLLFLSLGVGFVETQEATHVIRAWRLSNRQTRGVAAVRDRSSTQIVR